VPDGDANAAGPTRTQSGSACRPVATTGAGLWGEAFKGPPFSAAPVAGRRSVMGKYVIGWMLGVPVIVLVIIYLLFN